MSAFDDDEYQFILSDYDFKPKSNKETVVGQEKLEEASKIDATSSDDSLVAYVSTEGNTVDDDANRHVIKPITFEELELMASQQMLSYEVTENLRDKTIQLASICGEYQLPKGTRAFIRRLESFGAVALATKALAAYCMELNDERLLQSIQESKLQRLSNKAYELIQNHLVGIQENLDEIENLIREGEDRPLLNTYMRDIKGQTSRIFVDVEKQAKAFAKAITMYAPDKSSLPLLKVFAERNDKKVVASIDRTLSIVGTSVVLVDDAPAMLNALERNDTDTMIGLQKKLIDYLTE